MEGLLVLCDIDGTLVDTGGAGLQALQRAARDLFGAEGPPLDLRGATDGGIARDLLAHFGEEPCPRRIAAFYRRYLHHLENHLGHGDFAGRALPGVEGLLAGMRDRGATLGLLTGNIAEGAAIKMRHYSLDGFFAFGAFGDDHHDRNRLGPIALHRAERATGRPFTGARTVVIGDTPKDIACGKGIGAMTVCVATGSFGEAVLRDEGADVVFPNFENYNKCIGEILAHDFWEIG